MSTRSTVHFINEDWDERHIVYVHHDGYPSHRGKQVIDFLREVKNEVKDTRFKSCGVTAARFVGYMLKDYHDRAVARVQDNDYARSYTDTHPLAAISVKLVNEDPCDIEYRYVVDCDDLDEEGLPIVVMHEVGMALISMAEDNSYGNGQELKAVLASL